MADNIFGATAIPSQDFDGGWHTFGALAEVSEDSNLVGGRAFFPNPTPANFLWVVFKVSDESIVAQVDLAALAGTSTAAWNDFTSADFDSPGDVALDPAEQYLPAVVTNGDFRFLGAGVSYPYGAGIVTASEGRFHNGGAGAVFADSPTSSVVFGADMLVEAAGGATHEATGTAAATGTTSATSTVDRVAAGSAAGTGTSSATATVTREGAGSAAATGVATSSAAVDRDAAATTSATGAGASTATITRQASGSAAATGAASATGTVDPGGIPVPPIAWRAGPPQAKWSAGPPESKWSTGGRLPVEVFRATSTETVRSGRISATAAGAAVDPTGFTVTVAFAPTDTAPAAASSGWKTATWDTDTTTSPTTYRAQAAIGPSGVQELAPGVWWMFAKVVASGETPIIPSGPFKVVP